MKLVNRWKGLVRLAVFAAIAPLLGGCIWENLPPCPPQGEVFVRFDWSDAPDARPEGMGILLYPTSGHSFWRYDINRAGGRIGISDGNFDIVTFNNDTEHVLFEDNDTYSGICATTREANITDAMSLTYYGIQPPRTRDAEQPVMAQPDMMWSAVKPARIIAAPDTVRLQPRRITAAYTLTVDKVENPESAAQMCMAVSGLSVAKVLADEGNVDYPVTVPAELSRDGDTFRGRLLSFGDCKTTDSNTLFLYFWLRDGSKCMFQYDISSQVRNAPDPWNVSIRLSGLSLPETPPPGSGGESAGMDVDVDDWEIIDIELSN